MNKGKRQIIQILNRNVVANVTMLRVLQIACFVASVFVLVLGVWTLIRSDLTAAQIVLGLLVSSFGPLVFLAIGLLLPVVSRMGDAQVE